MNLSDFEIGKWYASSFSKGYYFKVLGINTRIYCKTKEQHLDVISTDELSGTFRESYISNDDYWKNATPVDYKDIEHLIPEQYRETPLIQEALLFN
jgi:hypothetical protein